MRILAAIGFAVGMSAVLSGCIAAVIPLAAMGTIGKKELDRDRAKQAIVAAGAVDLDPAHQKDPAMAPPSSMGEFTGTGSGSEMADTLDSNGKRTSYLSRFFQPVDVMSDAPYSDFSQFALAQSAKLKAGEGISSVVLTQRGLLDSENRISCESKPLAVLIDLDDETGANWLEEDALYRQNGLIAELRRLRASNISVIWMSDQPARNADRIAALLNDAGLAESAEHDFLFLDRGEKDGEKDRKQARRWAAAHNYCIVAMAGDQRSDFDELYDYLRDPDGAVMLENMFGNGWFLTPPPLVPAADDAVSSQIQKEG